MHGRLLFALAAVALLAAAPGQAAVPSGNLLVNPGAEAGPGAPDSSAQLPLPGWTVESTFTAVQYGAPAFLTVADSTALGGGVNFFAGGPGGALSAATQVVDLSGAAAEIDAGQVTATLSALLGGFATQTDHATVTATFLSAEGNATGSLALPAVTNTDRNSVTSLIARSAAGAVPAGTRSASVRIEATRDEGSYNDGYIDNVSLVLASGGPPVFHKSVGVKLVSGRVGIRRPGSKQDVDLTGSDVIPLGSTIDAEHGALDAQLGAPRGRGAADREVLRGRLQGHADRRDHPAHAGAAAGVVSSREGRERDRQEEAEQAPPVG